MNSNPITRRGVLKSIPLAGASAIIAGTQPLFANAVTQVKGIGDPVRVSDAMGIVETTAGKVRGESRKGIFIYRGIPYAADTGGANRFLPARKPEPWTGIRSSLSYGPVCPYPTRREWRLDETSFVCRWNDGQPGEDCMRMNIWTPGVIDNAKRHVMVWIHGGGYGWGSGQELPAYEGENLARRGDVVVVTLNHRVNAFGFLNLAEKDERYATSGNTGMLDLVFALEWIRDNIGNFGGDPAKITIFGQSGGGGKVSTLMMMPSAKGLYQKAIVQSGSLLYSKSLEDSYRITEAVLKELQITKSSLNKLQEVSANDLLLASARAQAKLMPPASQRTGLGPDFSVTRHDGSWAPVADGKVIPEQRWSAAMTSDIPLLVGCTLNEFFTGLDKPDAFKLTDEELRSKLSQAYGEKADAMLTAFRASHPKANPFQLLSIIATQGVRNMAVVQAQEKAALRKAPAYLYRFSWQPEVLDGRLMAFHSGDLPFCWDNTDLCESITGGGTRARLLGAKMSQAWISFAKTGNPNHPQLQHWPAVQPGAAQTMDFNDVCSVSSDPDRRERDLTMQHA